MGGMYVSKMDLITNLRVNCFSIGNYFLSAAQAFFRSLPSAIFLFSSITNSQVEHTNSLHPILSDCMQANILPVIVTNHTVTIAAELVSHLR